MNTLKTLLLVLFAVVFNSASVTATRAFVARRTIARAVEKPAIQAAEAITKRWRGGDTTTATTSSSATAASSTTSTKSAFVTVH